MNRPIALLSDFGLKDHYVGSIKSVILKINPKAIIFDITHEVRPQNIREAAFLLYSVSPVLPKGTIVVAVVDPGVGSMRQALCIKTNKGFFIGPNNGIFSMVLNNEDHFEARVLANDRYFHQPVSMTFHGRDVFSPAAAWLSKGDIFKSLGPQTRKVHHLRLPQATYTQDRITGEIIYIDRFGNAMSNISKPTLVKFAKLHGTHITVKEKHKVSLKPFFSAGAPGSLIAVWNSNDLLEFAVKDDSAESRHGIKIGDSVVLS